MFWVVLTVGDILHTEGHMHDQFLKQRKMKGHDCPLPNKRQETWTRQSNLLPDISHGSWMPHGKSTSLSAHQGPLLSMKRCHKDVHETGPNGSQHEASTPCTQLTFLSVLTCFPSVHPRGQSRHPALPWAPLPLLKLWICAQLKCLFRGILPLSPASPICHHSCVLELSHL
jgi:hypothetical protein